MSTASDRRRQMIWMVGVRSKGSEKIFTPTSAKWFYTRSMAWEYITSEILLDNFNYFEYKPMKYLPS